MINNIKNNNKNKTTKSPWSHLYNTCSTFSTTTQPNFPKTH